MKNDDKIKYWFTTEKGVHVPVREGQSKEEALKERFSEPKFEKVGLLDGMGEHDEPPEERGRLPKKKTVKISARDNIKNMGIIQLEKSIRNLEKQIKIHEEKIRNCNIPARIEYWEREIEKFRNRKAVYQAVLEERRGKKWE